MRVAMGCRIAGPLVSVLLVVPDVASGASVTRGPYLQMGSNDAVTVRWRTDVPTDSRVIAGTSAGNLDLVFDDTVSTTEHAVRVTGLTAATRYYYAIGSTAEILRAGDSTTYFESAPATGSQRPVRVWVIGDSGTAGPEATAVYKAYLNHAGGTHTGLWLMLGDNAYSDGTDEQYQQAVFDLYPQMLRQTVLWPTLGNHDGFTADSASQSGPYYEIFTLPKQAEAGGVASGTEAYYSFDYGNIHLIVLDSYETSRTAGSPMLTWLESDLQATAADWIIAYWHHPPYSKGSHDSDSEAELVEMRENVLPILEAHGVDLVLSGHSHSYERSKFIDGHYGVSTTFSNAIHVVDSGSGRTDDSGAYNKPGVGVSHAGAVYAVAGSSGSIAGGTLDHPAMHLSLAELGSLVLDVNGHTLDARFLDDAGSVRDYFTVTKGPPDTTPEAFSFGDVSDVAQGAEQTSNGIVVAGINAPAAISVSGGEYSIDGGAFVSSAGTVSNGRTVQVRHTASASFSTATDTVLSIGGVSDTFTSTTRAADTTPDVFSFTDQAGVGRSVVVTSNAVTVAGLEAPAPISVSGGEYSIEGGGFVSGAGTVGNGQSVQVRHTASASFSTATDTVLNIGGVSDTFTSTTRAQPQPRAGGSMRFLDVLLGLLAALGSGRSPRREFRHLVVGALLLATPVAHGHGDVHERIVDLSRQVESRPNHQVLVRRARLYLDGGHPGQARHDLIRAFELAPERHEVLYYLAQAELALGKHLEALRSAERFLSRAGNDASRARGLVLAGDILIAHGQPLEGAERMLRALRLSRDPGPEHFLRAAEAFHAAGSVRSIRVLDEGLARLGPLITLQDRALAMEMETGRYQAALSRIGQILASQRQTPFLLYKKGLILKALQRPEQARQTLWAALAGIEGLPEHRKLTRAVQELQVSILKALDGWTPT